MNQEPLYQANTQTNNLQVHMNQPNIQKQNIIQTNILPEQTKIQAEHNLFKLTIKVN